jgi:hypothetical protein
MLARLVPLALLLAAGCGPAKLNESRTYPMAPGTPAGFDLPVIGKAQTLTVEFTSSAADVSVFVVKNPPAEMDDAPPAATSVLGTATGKSGTVTAAVPAQTPVRVMVSGAKAKTDVVLKVTNAK